MVVVLVLLPALGHTGNPASWEQTAIGLGVIIAKVAAFVAIMLIAGRKLVPLILHYTAHTGSRELFRLAVYAVALGVAYGAWALLGYRSRSAPSSLAWCWRKARSASGREEALPLRDAFAVLFFVSVGMLFNPHVLVERPWAVLATLAVIVGGNGLAAFGAVRLLGQPTLTAWTVAASLGQIAEFSFILAGLHRAGHPAARGARSHPRRRDPLDPDQPIPVHGGRARARAADTASGRRANPTAGPCSAPSWLLCRSQPFASMM